MGNTTQQLTPQATHFYRLPQLKARLNVSGSSIWAWVAKGTFPKPVKLSPKCTAWDAASVEAWAQARISDSQK
jgi:prophage regulatory protein